MVSPAIAVWVSVMYVISSPSLNLWKVENPIVLFVKLTNPPSSVESNITECSFWIKLAYAIHPDPFPPLIFKVGAER